MPLPFFAEIRAARAEAERAVQAHNDRALALQLVVGLEQVPEDVQVVDIPEFPAWKLLTEAQTRWGAPPPPGPKVRMPAVIAQLRALAALVEAKALEAPAALERLQGLQREQVEACNDTVWAEPCAKLTAMEAERRTLAGHHTELAGAVRLDMAIVQGFQPVLDAWDASTAPDAIWRDALATMTVQFSGELVGADVVVTFPGPLATIPEWRAFLAEIAARLPGRQQEAEAIKARHDALLAHLLAEMG